MVLEESRPISIQSPSQRISDAESERILVLLPFKACHDEDVTDNHKEISIFPFTKPVVAQPVKKLPNVKELAMKP
jgi:hypothetical protein